jgi:CheY-like chemotaxis protein
MTISLPVYQHPTSVVLVDDSASFIASVEYEISPSLAVKSFLDPHEALAWLGGLYHSDDGKLLPIRVGYDEQTYSFERRTIALDVDQIYRIVHDPKRFQSAAVVVVDYAMAAINGLDFCRALRGLPCKKILFTGEANEMIAVEAFNQGLIDRYLKKSDPSAMDRLEYEIATLQREYFIEKSGTLKDLLVQHTYSFVQDEAIVKLVDTLLARHGFVEYFLFPDPAGILFFDADGKAMLMVVETRAGLISHLETAQDYDAPAVLCTALREAQVVPFFWKSGGMYTEKSIDWQQYCLPAQICAGKENFYYALFDLPEGFLQGSVYSYNKFLSDRINLEDQPSSN